VHFIGNTTIMIATCHNIAGAGAIAARAKSNLGRF